MLQGDVVEGVTELKAQDGGPVLVGGSKTLVHTLLADVEPVRVGGGKRLPPPHRADDPHEVIDGLCDAQAGQRVAWLVQECPHFGRRGFVPELATLPTGERRDGTPTDPPGEHR